MALVTNSNLIGNKRNGLAVSLDDFNTLMPNGVHIFHISMKMHFLILRANENRSIHKRICWAAKKREEHTKEKNLLSFGEIEMWSMFSTEARS